MSFKSILLFLFSVMMVSICVSCSNEEEPSPSNEGSPRDWTYIGDNVKVYINGEIQTRVKELRVRSIQLSSGEESISNPIYDTTLIIKGLSNSNKTTNIQVIATLDNFSGTTTIDGHDYNVSGEYIGNPFETHYSKLCIIVRLESK